MENQPNVLVVDDNADLLNTFSLILKRRGFNVDTAKEGMSAVDKHQKYHFDVILMDVVMPGMNGVETFKKLKEIDPAARVILMTAYYDEGELKNVLREGVFQALYKPVDIGQLMSLIDAATSGEPILIVDDDPDFCQVLAKALRLKGFRVRFATSGGEAVEIAQKARFDAAFIDIKMPGMGGLETCLKLRESNPDLLSIMMTAYRDEAREVIEKVPGKPLACIYKPFDLTQILEIIKTPAGNHRKEE
jgi:DNA-binding NtrC family response regulator